MNFENDDRVTLYSWRLRAEECGNTLDVRQQGAKRELTMRLEEIARRKERQKKLILAVYVIAAVFSFFKGVDLIAVVLMNMAAFHYGKYSYLDKSEINAFETALKIWEEDGKPTGEVIVTKPSKKFSVLALLGRQS
ncbi:MAG: hypothetical protein P8Q25_08305 [Porticoccaceae bacterium]|jgi:hypothetical protein|nr:hypothetical protein [Porticoccaceae bacterium]